MESGLKELETDTSAVGDRNSKELESTQKPRQAYAN